MARYAQTDVILYPYDMIADLSFSYLLQSSSSHEVFYVVAIVFV
jgi:hypothetical protein